jgi:SAM-dependent methyltransferase
MKSYPDELIPPSAKRRNKEEMFKFVGEKFVGHLRDLCGLRPDERVLEVGSGFGRVAIPLGTYLSSLGSYEGLDPSPLGVRWCESAITPRWPNFRFRLIDVQNERFNPNGSLPADNYRFPFESGEFDVAVTVFVFFHLLPEAVERYFFETARVLRRGGRFLANFYLVNEESLALMEAGRTEERFPHPRVNCHLRNAKVPEDLIAHDEAFVLDLYEREGFEVQRLEYGRWRGDRQDPLGVLDLIVARRA